MIARRELGVLFVAAPLSLYSAVQALAPDELAALMESAETKEQHLKLAKHYAAKAEEFETAAGRHEAIGKLYRQRSAASKGKVSRTAMANHCKNFVQSLRTSAKEARQLASAHEEMAKGAAQ